MNPPFTGGKGVGYLRVAVLQATGAVGSPQKNMRNVAFRAREARKRGADLLVTPELYATGYAPDSVHGTDGAGLREQLAAIAAASGIGLVASTVEHSNGFHYISPSLFDSTGTELTRYRKQHLFGDREKLVFTPGHDAPEVVLCGGIRIALGICFDIEFPEFSRAAALAGAQLLCVPTAVPLRSVTGSGAHPFDTGSYPPWSFRRGHWRASSSLPMPITPDLILPVSAPSPIRTAARHRGRSRKAHHR